MNSFDTFRIPFRGLKPGIHRYDFQIGNPFFERFQEGEIRNGNVSVHLDLDKEERMLIFHFSISGEVTLPCDRCNEPVQLEVNGKERLIVKFGDTFEEQSEELQIIPESETHFDTAPFFYECIHLLLPMRRIHPENGQGKNSCNPEILRKLDELTTHHEPDPRWEKLKELGIF
ncbi:MAG: DUF177 domain-containing protein [bacterium]